MDLVQTLSAKLGVSPEQAQGLAGGLLGVVNGAVHHGAGADAASQLQAAVPELKNWLQTAAAHQNVPAAASSGDLLGMLGSMLGSGQGAGAATGNLGTQLQGNGAAAAMTTMLAKYGVKPEQLASVAPILGQFLQHRMGSDGAQSVLGKVLPMLTSPQAQGALGGIASALGGLFGKK
jgi:Protein of unknown function VcgC/VcgE (DUF2780)